MNTAVLYNGVDSQMFSPPRSATEQPVISAAAIYTRLKDMNFCCGRCAIQNQFPEAIIGNHR